MSNKNITDIIKKYTNNSDSPTHLQNQNLYSTKNHVESLPNYNQIRKNQYNQYRVGTQPQIIQNQYQNQNSGKTAIILPPTHSIFRNHQSIQHKPQAIIVKTQYVQPPPPPPKKIVQQYIVAHQPEQDIILHQPVHKQQNRCLPCAPCLEGCCVCCPQVCQVCCQSKGSCGCCLRCFQPGEFCSCCRVCCSENGTCSCCQYCCLPSGMCGCCLTCCQPGESCQCCRTCTKSKGSCECCEACCAPGCAGLTCCPSQCRDCCKNCCCPWWVTALIILLLLAALLIGLLLGLKKDVSPQTQTAAAPKAATQTPDKPQQGAKCGAGFFLYKGLCIKCPDGSSWDGQNCVVNQ